MKCHSFQTPSLSDIPDIDLTIVKNCIVKNDDSFMVLSTVVRKRRIANYIKSQIVPFNILPSYYHCIPFSLMERPKDIPANSIHIDPLLLFGSKNT